MKFSGLIRFTHRQPYKELSWTLGAIVLYALVFELVYPLIGFPIVPLAALPAMVAGWLFFAGSTSNITEPILALSSLLSVVAVLLFAFNILKTIKAVQM